MCDQMRNLDTSGLPDRLSARLEKLRIAKARSRTIARRKRMLRSAKVTAMTGPLPHQCTICEEIGHNAVTCTRDESRTLEPFAKVDATFCAICISGFGPFTAHPCGKNDALVALCSRCSGNAVPDTGYGRRKTVPLP